jgi:DNA-binding protein H-NS
LSPFADKILVLRMTEALDRPLTRRERATVLARIQALMEYWGITPDEIAAHTAPSSRSSSPEPQRRIKYRHPISGETWDGTGSHPEWLRQALLQEGLRVDELRPELQETGQTRPPGSSHDGPLSTH